MEEKATYSTDYAGIIAVDFDGTLCQNAWPGIGAPNLELIEYLKLEKLKGSSLILWTCRADEELKEAVEFCAKYGLEFDAVNENLPEIVELFGRDTRKIFANLYIDDRASTEFNLPFIQW